MPRSLYGFSATRMSPTYVCKKNVEIFFIEYYIFSSSSNRTYYDHKELDYDHFYNIGPQCSSPPIYLHKQKLIIGYLSLSSKYSFGQVLRKISTGQF